MRTPIARNRVIFRLTLESLAREAQSDRPTIGVGTIQSLRFETAGELFPENTLIIAVGFDVSAHAIAAQLRSAYMLSFSSSIGSSGLSQSPLIAAYSFPQAVRDGYMTPARWIQVNLPALEGSDLRDPASKDLHSTRNEMLAAGDGRPLSDSQVKAIVAHVLEHVAASSNRVMKALVIVASIVEAEHFRLALIEEARSRRNADVSLRVLTVFALNSHRSVTDTARDLSARNLLIGSI